MNNLIKKLEEINFENIFLSYKNIENLCQFTNYGNSLQCGIQYRPNEDIWSSANGTQIKDENDCILLNPLFKDTFFEQVINKYKLKKSRLIKVPGKSCYSMHKDNSPRLHIPLVTNPECYFVFKSGVVAHLEEGYIYWVDTTKMHTFINCSILERLHFVAVI